MRISRLAVLLIGAISATFAETGADLAFLTAEQARVAIVDESVEPYFSLLQTQEMSAKTGSVIDGDTLEAQRDACRKRYQAGVREFAPAEQAALRRVVAGVQPFLTAHYPAFAAEPWRFIKIARSFEGGMPHTRGHCIVLSDDVLPMYVQGDARPANPQGTMLLVHEQTHVVQRLHPEWFAPLYTESWGMVHLPAAPPATGELSRHQLVNPDGIACVWAFPVQQDGKSALFQPQVLLGGGKAVPRMPADFAVVALAIERRGEAYGYVLTADGKPRSLPLDSVAAYQEAFAPSEENFHPNEICAELFSRMVTLDLLGRPEDGTPCQKGLRGWAGSYLGATDAKVAHAPLPRMAAAPARPIGPIAPPPAPPAAPAANEVVHVLAKGETLTTVAKKFKVTIQALIKRNDIVDPATLKEGLRLIIPSPEAGK